MSQVLARIQARLKPDLRSCLSLSAGRLKSDASGLDAYDAEAIEVALAEDPMGGEQHAEIEPRDDCSPSELTTALQDDGHPVRGVVAEDSVWFLVFGREVDGAYEDATDGEVKAAAMAAPDAEPEREPALKAELRIVLGEIAELSAEPVIYAPELARLQTKRAALKAQILGLS